MKLKDLSIDLKDGASCVLRLRCYTLMFFECYYFIDDEIFFLEIQEIFGDCLISRVVVLKDVYFTILLDSDLFVKFKKFLDERGVNRG